MVFWKRTYLGWGILCMLFCWTSCGDVYRPVAEPVIGPGPDPSKAGNVYALYRNPITDDAGTEIGQLPGVLSKIDASGDTNMANMQLGKGPVASTYLNGSNSAVIYVANSDATITYQITSNFQFPTNFNLFSDPSVPGFAPPQPVWLTSSDSSRIYVVNKQGPSPAPQAGCTEGSGSISILSSQALISTLCAGIEVNPTFAIQVPGAGKLYVLNTGTNAAPGSSVSVLDPTLQAVVQTIPVGNMPVRAAFNADASRLYVANQASGTLSIIDTANDQVVGAPIPVGTQPNYVLFDKSRNRLYVTNGGDGTLSVFDTSHGDPTAALATIRTSTASGTNPNPTAVAATPDGTRIYVANSGTADVAVIDATALSLITGNPGYCTKPSQSDQVTCPNRYDTIPLRWDFSNWSTTQTPTPVPVDAEHPVDSNLPLWIESEATSAKIYVTTPYQVPQSSGGTVQPGVTSIRTLDNRIAGFIPGPQKDINCQPNPGNPSATPPIPPTVCDGQIPVMILGLPH